MSISSTVSRPPIAPRVPVPVALAAVGLVVANFGVANAPAPALRAFFDGGW